MLPKASDSELEALGMGDVESSLLVHRGISTVEDMDLSLIHI